MKSPIWILTGNVLREMRRDRTFSVLFFGALILVVISSLLGSLSFDEQRRILVHLGLTSIHLSLLGIVLFHGAFVLQKELDRQTCLMVLARPVSRFQLLIGLWMGIALLMVVHLGVQTLFLWMLLGFSASIGKVLQVVGGMMLEMLVLLSFMFMIVQWVRPILALFAGLGIFLVGNWLEELRFLAEKSKDQGLKTMSMVLDYIFPNLYLLNWRSESFLFSLSEFSGFTPFVFIHFLIWILMFLMIARIGFQRRDLA